VDGATVGAIERGLCVLVGLHRDDTSDDIDYAYAGTRVTAEGCWTTDGPASVRKLLNLRLFEAGEDARPWTASVADLQLGILSGVRRAAPPPWPRSC
jgi:D-aminoacyl-tRNA deacylase